MQESTTATKERRSHVDQSLLLYATRYALGRMSYAVGLVCDEIDRLIPAMDANEREVLRGDIEDALFRALRRHEWCGMEMDHRRWDQTLARLYDVVVAGDGVSTNGDVQEASRG